MSSRSLARRSDQMPAPSGVRPVVIEHGEWRKRRDLHSKRSVGSCLRHPERRATVWTMKLYYSPGACSLAPHIALEETGAAFEPVLVKLTDGEQNTPDYRRINFKGRVPAIADGDFIVTENPACLRYVARRFPDADLWPEDPREEARCAEWLAWMSSTIHVAYAHVRRAERYATGDAAMANVQERGKESCRELWAQVDERLAAGPWALGERYSVADPYLTVFWMWGRGPVLGFDMAGDFPNWTAQARRMGERPAVRRAFAREGGELP